MTPSKGSVRGFDYYIDGEIFYVSFSPKGYGEFTSEKIENFQKLRRPHLYKR